MRRSATVTMRLPYGRITSQTFTAAAGKPFSKRLEEIVSAFANRRGVSYFAVDYDVTVRA